MASGNLFMHCRAWLPLKKAVRKMRAYMFTRIFGGFLMALADSVPGVSGGTIAFLIGIYDEFITSLNNILSRDREKRRAAILFLLKMGSGWIVGMVLAALVITGIFESHIYAVSSLFLGFVLFAIPIIISEERESFAGKYYNVVFTVVGAALVAAITYYSQTGIISGGVDLSWGSFGFGIGVYVFIAAMCAISAMVLPGISGSTLLLVFGLYQPVMSAIKGFIKLDFSYFVGLVIFGLGVIAGILTIVKVLRYGLEKRRSAMMYFIIGMMLGSLYAIVMGPTSLKDNPQPAMTLSTFHWVPFIIGGAVIIGLQVMKVVMGKRSGTEVK
jgi:putative membrane protein